MNHETFEDAVRRIVLPFLFGFHIDDRILLNKPPGLITTIYLCSELGAQTTYTLHKNNFGEFYFTVNGPGKLGAKYTSPLIVAVSSQDRLLALEQHLRASLTYLDTEKSIAEKNEILERIADIKDRSPEHFQKLPLLDFLDRVERMFVQ